MTDFIPELDPNYGLSSATICGAHRHGQITTSQLLAKALEAALDLEARGVPHSECWRNDRDWQALGRIGLIASSINLAIMDSLSSENHGRWLDRRGRIASIKLVSP